MGNNTGDTGAAGPWAVGGVGPGSVPASDLMALLGPWEDGRLRRHRERRAVEGLGFRFTEAPPGRVRQAYGVLSALHGRSYDDLLLARPGRQPPMTALVGLAESHWGRLGGHVGYAPDRMRTDQITVPAARAAGIDQAVRGTWPDALPLALVNTWASWTALEPLEEVTGDHFDRLDLEGAAVITWSWD
jgi:hypothetical protein